MQSSLYCYYMELEARRGEERYPFRLITGEEKEPVYLESGEIVIVKTTDSVPALMHRLDPNELETKAFLVSDDPDKDEMHLMVQVDPDTQLPLEDGLRFKRRKDKKVTPRTFWYADVFQGEDYQKLRTAGVVATSLLAVSGLAGFAALRVKKKVSHNRAE